MSFYLSGYFAQCCNLKQEHLLFWFGLLHSKFAIFDLTITFKLVLRFETVHLSVAYYVRSHHMTVLHF